MRPSIVELTLIDEAKEGESFSTWRRAEVRVFGQVISVQDVKVEITSEGPPIATLRLPVRLQYHTTVQEEPACKGCNGERTVLRYYGSFGEYGPCGECGGTGRA